jgi:predicted phosphodiesterase
VKVGIVSDIHCNAAGLAQALALMGDIDELICLGDSIYEYRFSNEVVGCLRQRDARVIVGNHEEYFFGPQQPDHLVRKAVFVNAVAKTDQFVDIAHEGKRLRQACGIAVNIRDDPDLHAPDPVNSGKSFSLARDAPSRFEP